MDSSLFNPPCHTCAVGNCTTIGGVEVEHIPVWLEMCIQEMDHSKGQLHQQVLNDGRGWNEAEMYSTSHLQELLEGSCHRHT
eukprot:12921083-Prorocentrum_lima.AAC.1